jgi:hypothetical protein
MGTPCSDFELNGQRKALWMAVILALAFSHRRFLIGGRDKLWP